MSAGVAYIDVEGDPIPLMASRTCLVCRSPHRDVVEQALAIGTPATQIVLDLPDAANLSVRNLLEHKRRGHLRVNPHRVQEAAEEAGKALREALRTGTINEGLRLALAQEIVRRGIERLLKGKVQVTVAQTIRAAKIVAEHEAATRAFDRDKVRRAVEAVSRAARSLLSKEDQRRFLIRVMDDPDARGLKELDGVRL